MHKIKKHKQEITARGPFSDEWNSWNINKTSVSRAYVEIRP